MLTPAQFRAAFPAFADATVYSDAVVAAAYAASASEFDVTRWGARLDLLGQGPWVAWYLSVNPPPGAVNSSGAAVSAGTASTTGDVTSKTVGRKTIQRSSEMLKLEAENPYMKNDYGRTYWFWAQRVGVGAIVVTGGFADCGPCPPWGGGL